MDGFGEQRLADPRLSDDHEGLMVSREERDFCLESRNRRAAAYDFDRIQSSGPGVNDQVK